MDYFEQTKHGQSHWWSWIAVSWLAFVGWLVLQTILLMPLPIIANFTTPPLFDSFMAAVASNPSSEASSQLGTISVLSGLGATGGIILSLMVAGSAKTTARNLSISGMLICVVTSVLSSQGSDSSAIMDVVGQIMGASPLAFALFLLTFPAGLIVLFVCQRKVHKRTITSLHTAAKKFRIPRVVEGFFLTWIVLGAFSIAANALGIIEVKYIFAGGKFWIYALISLLFIPFQAAAEEIVFRGYFNQGLTHVLKNKWFAFFVTSAAFMALHLSNPEALEGAASGTLPIVMSDSHRHPCRQQLFRSRYYELRKFSSPDTLGVPDRNGPDQGFSIDNIGSGDTCRYYLVASWRSKAARPRAVNRHTIHSGRIGLANQGSAYPSLMASRTNARSIGSPN